MAGGNFQQAPRKKIALDNRKLFLSTRTPGVEGKFASLQWGLFSNNPRITVFTGDPNDQGADKNYGKISANLDAPAFFMMLEVLHEIIEGPNGEKKMIPNKAFIFPGGKRSERPVVTSELWIGKDDKGVIWLSVVDALKRERPKIQFKIGIHDFHEIRHADGTPYSEGDASKAWAKGYYRMLGELMSHLLVTEWKEPEPKPDGGGFQRGGGGGGGGGGYGNRGGGGYGGGGGGYGGGAPAGGDTTGSDIPF